MSNYFQINLKFKILTILLFISIISWGKIVKEDVAKSVAINFFKSVYFDKTGEPIKRLSIKNSYSIKSNNEVTYYIFNFNKYGFVQVSADDAAYPILAFDFNNQVNNNIKAENYLNWVNRYIKQINYIREHNIKATKKIAKLWQALKTNNNTIALGKSIDPLLLSKWNQDALYNADCPEDQNGPGGRVYAGCVATAMAQIMYYYRYPYQGVGTKTYTHYLYGSMSANFGATTYNWNEMTNTMSASGNPQIAQLLYHLGISVEMDYSASGSGAFSNVAAYSLRHFFKYSSNLSYESKSDFTYNQWVNKIVANIDSGRPLYYDGFGNDGGHAFDLDGYQGSDHFHFNWGWGGAYNGYFYLGNLNPGSSSFNNGQSAMFNIYPASSYPYYCSNGNQYTNLVGNFSDGSGPQKYNNNAQCNWLIHPSEPIENIKLTFDKFDIHNSDTLYIYDGSSNTDSLLAKLSGDQIPNNIFSTGNSVYIEFISDGANTSQGFDISYESFFPIFCQGTALYTDSIANIEDGSNSQNYNNSTFCKWLIKPTNGYPIRLIFDSFDLEQNHDIIKIYNPASSPSQLLATYTGNNIPPSVVSPSGEMFIVFITNASQTAAGWKAHYITGPSVGINQKTNKNKFEVFPNPANTFLYVKSDNTESISKILLLSLDGKLIKDYKKPKVYKAMKLDISNIESGIYILNIISSSSSYTRKIIITN